MPDENELSAWVDTDPCGPSGDDDLGDPYAGLAGRTPIAKPPGWVCTCKTRHPFSVARCGNCGDLDRGCIAISRDDLPVLLQYLEAAERHITSAEDELDDLQRAVDLNGAAALVLRVALMLRNEASSRARMFQV